MKADRYAPRPLLPREIAQWPADVLYEYHERAAIMEHDGHIAQPEAERKAMLEIRRRHDGAMLW